MSIDYICHNYMVCKLPKIPGKTLTGTVHEVGIFGYDSNNGYWTLTINCQTVSSSITTHFQTHEFDRNDENCSLQCLHLQYYSTMSCSPRDLNAHGIADLLNL